MDGWHGDGTPPQGGNRLLVNCRLFWRSAGLRVGVGFFSWILLKCRCLRALEGRVMMMTMMLLLDSNRCANPEMDHLGGSCAGSIFVLQKSRDKSIGFQRQLS